MRTRPLGRTGIKVSPYCLGTMMFGPFGNPDPDPDDCVRIIHRALEAGISRWDRAAGYVDTWVEKADDLRGEDLRRW